MSVNGQPILLIAYSPFTKHMSVNEVEVASLILGITLRDKLNFVPHLLFYI